MLPGQATLLQLGEGGEAAASSPSSRVGVARGGSLGLANWAAADVHRNEGAEAEAGRQRTQRPRLAQLPTADGEVVVGEGREATAPDARRGAWPTEGEEGAVHLIDAGEAAALGRQWSPSQPLPSGAEQAIALDEGGEAATTTVAATATAGSACLQPRRPRSHLRPAGDWMGAMLDQDDAAHTFEAGQDGVLLQTEAQDEAEAKAEGEAEGEAEAESTPEAELEPGPEPEPEPGSELETEPELEPEPEPEPEELAAAGRRRLDQGSWGPEAKAEGEGGAGSMEGCEETAAAEDGPEQPEHKPVPEPESELAPEPKPEPGSEPGPEEGCTETAAAWRLRESPCAAAAPDAAEVQTGLGKQNPPRRPICDQGIEAGDGAPVLPADARRGNLSAKLPLAAAVRGDDPAAVKDSEAPGQSALCGRDAAQQSSDDAETTDAGESAGAPEPLLAPRAPREGKTAPPAAQAPPAGRLTGPMHPVAPPAISPAAPPTSPAPPSAPPDAWPEAPPDAPLDSPSIFQPLTMQPAAPPAAPPAASFSTPPTAPPDAPPDASPDAPPTAPLTASPDTPPTAPAVALPAAPPALRLDRPASPIKSRSPEGQPHRKRFPSGAAVLLRTLGSGRSGGRGSGTQHDAGPPAPTRPPRAPRPHTGYSIREEEANTTTPGPESAAGHTHSAARPETKVGRVLTKLTGLRPWRTLKPRQSPPPPPPPQPPPLPPISAVSLTALSNPMCLEWHSTYYLVYLLLKLTGQAHYLLFTT